MSQLQKSRKVGEPYTPDPTIDTGAKTAAQIAAAKGREALAKIEQTQQADALKREQALAEAAKVARQERQVMARSCCMSGRR